MPKGTSTKTTKKVVAGKVSHASPVTLRRPTHDEVARRAYEIYLSEGGLDGRHEEHWQRAEAELSAAV